MLNWGVIGAGRIASIFCNSVRLSKEGRIAAVASRSLERAENLASTYSIPKSYSGYQALLADDEIDAVYINNIHPAHAEWTIQAAKAGKHILVEKPIGMNFHEASAMVDAARENDVFLMEAFAYRSHPQTHKLVELVRDGRIGQVQVIRGVFSFRASYDPASRLFAKELGGGAILDVGCYPASMSRLIAGAASDMPFLDPVEVKGSGQLGPTGVDHYAAATLRFENDIIAEIITGVTCQIPSEVSIYGTEGMLKVPSPWLPSSLNRFAGTPVPLDYQFPACSLILERHDEEAEEIVIDVDRDPYAYEADTAAEYIDQRQSPTMNWDDSLGNMKLLDRWLSEVGVSYDG